VNAHSPRTPHPESVRATARRLRREGLSIRMISAQIGVPAATVGVWLRGEGQVALIKTCWCGERFISRSWKARSCSRAHQQKRRHMFGPLDYSQEAA